MKVYVCGDTHSNINIKKLNNKNWNIQKDLNKNDLLIILGDFGLIWNNCRASSSERWWLNWLSEKNCTVAFIDGNHENFDRLEQFKIIEKWGGKVQEVYKNVIHLMRGEVYTFGDKKVLTVGGAESIDKMFRKEYISWWRQESITKVDFEKAMNNLEIVDFKVDYVLTHTIPQFMQDNLPDNFLKINQPSMKVLDDIERRVQYKQWHFGHYHIDMQISDKFFAHYDDEPMRII